jgi:hypothetical protein
MRLQPSSTVVYDEQLGMTFTQDFTSMLYNVTAVEQSDPVSSYGPAYLLNGLSDAGYWYQVGLTWNWYPGKTPGTGWDLVYEVFDTTGKSIFPVTGGGGLLVFSGTVNQGDSVSLNLYFDSTSRNVVMLATDRNTGASASETYDAKGATRFVGNPSGTANSNGFFTGLMTEWYHPSEYLGDEQKVTYVSGFALNSAWMWIDEFSCSNSNCTTTTLQFASATNGPVLYTIPNQLVSFSSNGANEYSNAYSFITGSLSLSSLKFRYSVLGGGSYSPPVVTYIESGGKKTGVLDGGSSIFLVDVGTRWNVTDTLPGSGPSERWMTINATTGTAEGPQNITLLYYHQYHVNFTVNVQGGGSGYSQPNVTFLVFGETKVTPTGQLVWADSGSNSTFDALLPGSSGSERWIAASSSTAASAAGLVTQTYLHQYYVRVGAVPSRGGSVSSSTGWFNAGGTVVINAVPAPSWQFEGWSGKGSGAYSSGSAAAMFSVSGPANETALFYPGLNITVSGSGVVNYFYGVSNGTVSSGSQTIFLPPGTSITLAEAPSSFLYSFDGWSGSLVQGTAPQQQVQISDPTKVTASFGYNPTVIGGLVAAIASVVLGSSVLLGRRRRPHTPL